MQCITCPPKRVGPNCTEVEIIRKKRAFSFGSCPYLRPPTSGSRSCIQKGNYRSCTGSCLPGDHFEGEKNAISLTLECHTNSWSPRRNFPPCKSGGHCELVITGAGSYNCTTSINGTRCDITCGSRKIGRYHCYPGRKWNPLLPSCVVPKDPDKISLVPSCRCQNGGTCLAGGRCSCPSGTTGSLCEIKKEKINNQAGSDCNLKMSGPGAYNCTIHTDGRACDIRCDHMPQRRYYCQSGADWKPELPYCTSPKESREAKEIPCHCVNGGICDSRRRCICPNGLTGSRCQNKPTGICSDPGSIQFGYHRLKNGIQMNSSPPYNIGQSIKYYCKKNYELKGKSLLTCLASGKWSSSRPSCQLIPIETTVYCSDPGQIPNGSYLKRTSKSEQFIVGQYVNYYCNLGYDLVGNSSVTCKASGGWSSKPFCRMAPKLLTAPGRKGICSDPGTIQFGYRSLRNGTPSQSNQTYSNGQIFQYYCNLGYALQGNNVIICMPSGKWSSALPRCLRTTTEAPISCKYPEHKPYSRPITSIRVDQIFPPRTELTYICDYGYETNDSLKISCLNSGLWSSSPPTCVRISPPTTALPRWVCPYPNVDRNGAIENFSSYNLKERGQGFEIGSALNFTCSSGYELKGPKSIYCLINGQWNSAPPTCTSIPGGPGVPGTFCKLPKIDETGLIIYPAVDINNRKQMFAPGTEMKFYCEEGYVRRIVRIIYCKLDGEWTSEPPTCRRLAAGLCPYPTVDRNGAIENPSDDSSERQQGFEAGSEVKFTCNNGYELSGSKSIICLKNGRWNNVPPTCTLRPFTLGSAYCPYLEADETVTIEDDKGTINVGSRQVYEPGAELKFYCIDDYILHGAHRLFCTDNGVWSDEPPFCIKSSDTGILCKDPGSIQNGGVIVYYNNVDVPRLSTLENNNAMEYPVGTRLSYNCSSAYRLEGQNILNCKPSGRWSAEKPTCIEDCGRSTLLAGGKVTHGTNTTAGEFPWIVFLYMNQTRNTCGGVLIDRRTVLSAAHCFVRVDYCTIYFGKYNRSDEDDDRHVLTRTSYEIIRHPEYTSINEQFDNDIAIVKFSPDIPFSLRIQPICMPSPATTALNIVPGKNGTVSGWGLNERRVVSRRLMMANLPVQSPETCLEAYQEREQRVARGMFCAGYSNAPINACSGDSGSPLVFYNNKTQRFVVEGVVSHGLQGRCDLRRKYTMFTRISDYLQWIYIIWRGGNK